MYYVRKIDTDGFFIEDMFVDELTDLTITTPCSSGFYRPRWNGVEWIEGLTQEEIAELNNQPRELTEIEKLKISQAEQFETILMLLGGMM